MTLHMSSMKQSACLAIVVVAWLKWTVVQINEHKREWRVKSGAQRAIPLGRHIVFRCHLPISKASSLNEWDKESVCDANGQLRLANGCGNRKGLCQPHWHIVIAPFLTGHTSSCVILGAGECCCSTAVGLIHWEKVKKALRWALAVFSWWWKQQLASFTSEIVPSDNSGWKNKGTQQQQPVWKMPIICSSPRMMTVVVVVVVVVGRVCVAWWWLSHFRSGL